MNFDYESYSAALDEFLTGMQSINNEEDTGTHAALERICSVLRVQKVCLHYYENQAAEKANDGIFVTFYDCGNADSNNGYEYRAVTDPGSIAIYHAYPAVGAIPWTELEICRIKRILSLLFIFHGRIRILRFINSLTYYDQVFKIPNLAYYMKHVETLIQENRIAEYAACFCNITQFSLVNQQVGREQGTHVMQSFVHKLSANFTDNEIICRIYGDNFVILFLKKRLNEIIDHLKGTVISSGGPVESKLLISAKAGIYMIPEECANSKEVMDCINQAINIARKHPKDSIVFYDEAFKQTLKMTKNIQILFPKAIRAQDIRIVYQPKYDIRENRIVGAEALCRWTHNGTQLMPNLFIPILEQNNTICALDFYVLEHVCATIRSWMDRGLPLVRISMNLSRCHLSDPDLLQKILNIVNKYEVPHEYIELELTETASDISSSDLGRIFFGLKRAGITISIDDFGAGYSSLKLLQTLSWDVLKLDKSFMTGIGDNLTNKNKILLKHLIAMVKELDAEFIVEGVETREQAEFLKQNGCYLVQGYLYDMPLEQSVFETRLEQLR